MSYRFNIDHELVVFDPSYSSNTPKGRSINEEFEYFFFFLEPGKELYTRKYYSPEYFNYIESKVGRRPITTKKGNPEDHKPYWNIHLDHEQAKILYSKETFYKFLQENPKLVKTNFKFFSDYKSIDAKNLDYPIVIKAPFLFSGMGVVKADSYLSLESNRNKIEGWLEKGQIIIEDLVDKQKDIGISISEDEINIYENIIGKQFQYQGSYYDPQVIFSCNEEIKLIKEYYEKLGIQKPWSIDAMIDTSGNYIFHEVNARKSMGWVFCQLNKKFNKDNHYSKLKIISSKKLKIFDSFETVLNLLPQDCLLLSPLSNKFVTFYFKAESFEKLDEIEKDIEKIYFSL